MRGKPWTDTEIEYLTRYYADTSTSVLAAKLHKPAASVYNKAYERGLKKSAAFMASSLSGRLTASTNISGLNTRFEKGHAPYNKGKKWDEVFSKETQEKCLASAFKKGHLPHNARADGEISIREYEGYRYQFIRVALRQWMPLHTYNWEKAFGKVPPGHLVVFKTPDHMNCDISNLELITHKEHMSRNTIARYPPELRLTIRTYHKLIRTINGKEQNTGSARSSV